ALSGLVFRQLAMRFRKSSERAFSTKGMRLARPEGKKRAEDSARHKQQARAREQRPDPRKRHARNRHHHHTDKHERKSPRPILPARPPLAGLVERAQPPQDERDARDHPGERAPVEKQSARQSQPDEQTAEEKKNQLRH